MLAVVHRATPNLQNMVRAQVWFIGSRDNFTQNWLIFPHALWYMRTYCPCCAVSSLDDWHCVLFLYTQKKPCTKTKETCIHISTGCVYFFSLQSAFLQMAWKKKKKKKKKLCHLLCLDYIIKHPRMGLFIPEVFVHTYYFTKTRKTKTFFCE